MQGMYVYQPNCSNLPIFGNDGGKIKGNIVF